ncbi:hypothetical protein HDE_12123 [Halotydeus destructor]|nr:hypothetical protein HDE_12123 [Halotydeus destructor]
MMSAAHQLNTRLVGREYLELEQTRSKGSAYLVTTSDGSSGLDLSSSRVAVRHHEQRQHQPLTVQVPLSPPSGGHHRHRPGYGHQQQSHQLVSAASSGLLTTVTSQRQQQPSTPKSAGVVKLTPLDSLVAAIGRPAPARPSCPVCLTETTAQSRFFVLLLVPDTRDPTYPFFPSLVPQLMRRRARQQRRKDYEEEEEGQEELGGEMTASCCCGLCYHSLVAQWIAHETKQQHKGAADNPYSRVYDVSHHTCYVCAMSCPRHAVHSVAVDDFFDFFGQHQRPQGSLVMNGGRDVVCCEPCLESLHWKQQEQQRLMLDANNCGPSYSDRLGATGRSGGRSHRDQLEYLATRNMSRESDLRLHLSSAAASSATTGDTSFAAALRKLATAKPIGAGHSKALGHHQQALTSTTDHRNSSSSSRSFQVHNGHYIKTSSSSDSGQQAYTSRSPSSPECQAINMSQQQQHHRVPWSGPGGHGGGAGARQEQKRSSSLWRPQCESQQLQHVLSSSHHGLVHSSDPAAPTLTSSGNGQLQSTLLALHQQHHHQQQQHKNGIISHHQLQQQQHQLQHPHQMKIKEEHERVDEQLPEYMMRRALSSSSTSVAAAMPVVPHYGLSPFKSALNLTDKRDNYESSVLPMAVAAPVSPSDTRGCCLLPNQRMPPMVPEHRDEAASSSPPGCSVVQIQSRLDWEAKRRRLAREQHSDGESHSSEFSSSSDDDDGFESDHCLSPFGRKLPRKRRRLVLIKSPCLPLARLMGSGDEDAEEKETHMRSLGLISPDEHRELKWRSFLKARARFLRPPTEQGLRPELLDADTKERGQDEAEIRPSRNMRRMKVKPSFLLPCHISCSPDKRIHFEQALGLFKNGSTVDNMRAIRQKELLWTSVQLALKRRNVLNNLTAESVDRWLATFPPLASSSASSPGDNGCPSSSRTSSSSSSLTCRWNKMNKASAAAAAASIQVIPMHRKFSLKHPLNGKGHYSSSSSSSRPAHCFEWPSSLSPSSSLATTSDSESLEKMFLESYKRHESGLREECNFLQSRLTEQRVKEKALQAQAAYLNERLQNLESTCNLRNIINDLKTSN